MISPAIPGHRHFCSIAMKIRPHSRNAGFSLVEVTLALGIAALGIIAVLGLMPQGMEMSRKTGLLSVHRQITEQIAREIDQKPWAEIVNAPPQQQPLYFDDQGLEVTADSPVLAFVVDVEYLNSGTMVLPQGAPFEPFLRRVLIKIANTTNLGFDFDDVNNRRQFVTMVHLVAKSS
jgi:uncharacterized protein (TIGR02598 family)